MKILSQNENLSQNLSSNPPLFPANFRPYLGLEASAGSGKTFALSVRFISLILSGANINEIVALTFTNKAADEMKERIVELFLKLDDKKAEREAIMQNLAIQDKKILIKRRDDLKDEFLKSNLKISTIDAFLARIVRSFSLDLGISPDFSVINDDELRDLAKKKFLSEISSEKELLKEVANFIANSDDKVDEFFKFLESLYEKVEDNPNFTAHSNFPSDAKFKSIIAKMGEFCEKNGGSSRAINMFSETSINKFIDKPFLAKDTLNYNIFSKIYTPELDEMFFELKDELKRYFNALEAHSFSHFAKMVKIYAKARKDILKKYNALTFFDISKACYELLSDESKKELMYFRLDAKVSHLLIDEFQDTSILQYKILKPLIDEIVAGFGQNGLGSLFYVGDVKQSIYRFRGGVKELFGALKQSYTRLQDSQIHLDTLNTNYRSDGVIVEFVNENFKSVYGSKHIQKVQDGRENLGFVEVLSSTQVFKEAALKAKQMVDSGTPQSDIAILCWKNRDVDTLKSELEILSLNGSGEGDNRLFNTPFVMAILEFIKFSITGEKIYLENVKALIDIKTIPNFSLDLTKTPLETAIFVAKILGISLKDKDVINFIEISKNYKNIIDLAFANDQTKSESKDSDGVSIMTVHKSKGLQFKHLIVCDKVGGDMVDRSKFLLEFDMRNFSWDIALRVKGRESVDENYKEILDRKNALDRDENINKIYVALTRPKHSLIIIKNSKIPAGQGDRNPTLFCKYNEKANPLFELVDIKIGNFNPNPDEDGEQEIKVYKNSSKITLERVKTQDEILEKAELEKAELEEFSIGAINFGLAFHYALERLSSFEIDDAKLAVLKSKNRYAKFLTDGAFDDIEKRVLVLLKSREFLEIVDGGQIFKEVPIKISETIRYIDLLVLKDDEIFIVDYKTGSEHKERYAAQILEYKSAISEIYPKKFIKPAIIYISNSGVKVKKFYTQS